MTVEPAARVFDLNTEIKELELKLRQADLRDKDNMAKELAELKTRRRNQNRGSLFFQFPLHKPKADAPIVYGEE